MYRPVLVFLEPEDVSSTRLSYVGFLGGLENLKTKTRLINARVASAMGECVVVDRCEKSVTLTTECVKIVSLTTVTRVLS